VSHGLTAEECRDHWWQERRDAPELHGRWHPVSTQVVQQVSREAAAASLVALV